MPLSPSYLALRAEFSWDLPKDFNFGADVIDRIARENDHLALIWENDRGESGQLLFSEVAKLTNSLAAGLAAKGLVKGDRLIVMLPRSPEWALTMMAAVKLGVVPIPCIEMQTARDLAWRIENSGARGVVCRAQHAEKFRGIADSLPARVTIGAAPEGWTEYASLLTTDATGFSAARLGLEEPTVMYYTSGSTGHPKGVLISARGMFSWRVAAKYWLDLNPEDRMWCTADTGWSKAATTTLFGSWSRGATTFIYDGPFTPKERLRLLEKHQITVYCAASTEISRLLNEKPESYRLALRHVVSAGEAVNPTVAAGWKRATGIRMSEGYGQTETLMIVTNIPGEPIHFGSMGLPLPGSDIAIVDPETGRECAVDEEGVIAMRPDGPQLMLEYWKDEARTKASFAHGWYLTGDRARRDENGYFWFAGRDDDLINSSGYRIGPMEVENALLEHDAVQECGVVGLPDEERGELVTAFIVLRDGHAPSDALKTELQNHTKKITAPYKYPRQIHFVAELPKTATGKISRRLLREKN